MVLLNCRRIGLGLAVAIMLIALSAASISSRDGDDPLEQLAVLHNNLGVVQALNDDFYQAELHFDSAFILIGDNAAICNNTGNSYLCQGAVSDALRLYERAYGLDSLDKRILFNWSLALYLSGAADEAVDMMQQFLSYYGRTDDTADAISWLRDEGFSKGETQVTTAAEVKRLMDKAKAKLKQALERKRDTYESTDKDSIAANSETKPQQQKRTIPAGGKAIESASVTSLLYWIVL